MNPFASWSSSPASMLASLIFGLLALSFTVNGELSQFISCGDTQRAHLDHNRFLLLKCHIHLEIVPESVCLP